MRRAIQINLLVLRYLMNYQINSLRKYALAKNKKKVEFSNSFTQERNSR